MTFQRVSLDAAATAALYRLRTCLQNIEFAVITVLAPLDIHRTVIVFFDRYGHLCERDNIVIAYRKAAAVGRLDIDCIDRFAGPGIVAVDHFDALAAQILAQYRLLASGQCRLVDVKFIRINSALDDRLAKTIGGGDEDGVPKPRLCVERKNHA